VFKAQELVFKQGDMGDFMYVILKGKVSVYVDRDGKKGVNILIATPSDGECFGELSLFDFNKINPKATSDVITTEESKRVSDAKLDVKKRAATCTSSEETFMLRINHVKARDML
jgi:CRP-like cAMP-binding protein